MDNSSQKYIRSLIRRILSEYLTPSDLETIEHNADEIFSDVGVDIDFSSHFLDRANDPRNGKEVEPEELNNLFVKTKNKYGTYLKNMPRDSERVVNDTKTALNVPIIAVDKTPSKNTIRAKTIIRKKDFTTSNPKLKV